MIRQALDIQNFKLEAGGCLEELHVVYHTAGPKDGKVIWVCHALTANSDVEDWWPQVARAVRQLFDDYAAEQERKQQERLQAGQANITYVNNNNITNENSQTDQRCWGMKVEKADQLIGVAEQDSKIIYSKMNNLTT
jgi:hypothetical protein